MPSTGGRWEVGLSVTLCDFYSLNNCHNTIALLSTLVTMFKLLTGYRPFTDDNFNTFVEMATTMNALVREHCDSPEYAILFQEVPFPSFLSPEAKDLIR